MRVLILGTGQVGGALAKELTAAGHFVRGTTTRPSRTEELAAICSDVVVLRGDDRDAVAAAARDVDAVVLTMSPRIEKTVSPEERNNEYRQTLADSAINAAAAHDRLIFLSSFSVYGDGGTGDGPITEESPVSTSSDASTVNYLAAESAVLGAARGCVLRAQDIYGGPKDFSFLERLKLGHSLMGGKVPFGADGLLYRLHYLDAVASIKHALDHGLTGTYNVCFNDQTPPTVKQVFDRLADENGLERLQFMGMINNPARMISSAKVEATGFHCAHTDYDFR